jgi:hypothetical protein
MKAVEAVPQLILRSFGNITDRGAAATERSRAAEQEVLRR